MIKSSISAELRSYHEALGITEDFYRECKLPLCEEPELLVETEPDYYGRPQQLTPEAFAAWTDMKTEAADSGVTIHLISAYRGIAYQFELIKRKLQSGEDLKRILTVNAAPGFSEHHSGRAVDIGTLNCPALVEEFENTPAFAWLGEHASRFGFRLSYPRNNSLGISYEPWHWCFSETVR